MVRKLLYSKACLVFLRNFFSLFYEKKYLDGKFFEEKRLGWLWAFSGIPRRLLGRNRKTSWPVGKSTIVANSKNIIFDNSSINVFQMSGCYFQAHRARIIIGKNVEIAPNCGIITTNHDVYNPENHVEGKDIVIGDNCWIGMNSVILPGVVLGNNTIVGAGSVVTKSFSEGYMVIGGVPAKVIYKLEESKLKNRKG